MELSERERRILAELEYQLSTGTPGTKGRLRKVAPIRPSVRPHWTIAPAAVLGSLLLMSGIAFGVAGALLLGTLLVLWWLYPLLSRMLRRPGRALRVFLKDAPPGPVH